MRSSSFYEIEKKRAEKRCSEHSENKNLQLNKALLYGRLTVWDENVQVLELLKDD